MDKHRYLLVFSSGVVAFIISAVGVLEVSGGDVPPLGSPLWKLRWALVTISMLGAMLGMILILKLEELWPLRRFKKFIDATFSNDNRREAVMRRLELLADRTEEASQRVIALQRGGLKEIDRDSENPEQVKKNFETAYEGANRLFRDVQNDFYHYLDIVEPLDQELKLRLGSRYFKNYCSSSPFQQARAK